MPRKAPRQGVDLNGGTYGTPVAFIKAVEREFGPLVFDLASDGTNNVAAMCYTPAEDSLSQAWSWIVGWAWLNPPYDDIGKWAKKAYSESLLGAKILMLVPASVGSNWYRDYVYGKAEVRFLNGRLTFVGHKAGYPKDLMLIVYDHGREAKQTIWNWRV